MEFQNEPGGIEVVIRRFRGATFKVAPHFFGPRVYFTEQKSPSDTALTFAGLAVVRSRDFPETVGC